MKDNEHASLTAEIWLFLLQQGGRWLSGDVAKGLGMESALCGQMLAYMHRNKKVRQFPVEGVKRRFRYGVTGECTPPLGVNVQQIAECVLAKPDEEVAT